MPPPPLAAPVPRADQPAAKKTPRTRKREAKERSEARRKALLEKAMRQKNDRETARRRSSAAAEEAAKRVTSMDTEQAQRLRDALMGMDAHVDKKALAEIEAAQEEEKAKQAALAAPAPAGDAAAEMDDDALFASIMQDAAATKLGLGDGGLVRTEKVRVTGGHEVTQTTTTTLEVDIGDVEAGAAAAAEAARRQLESARAEDAVRASADQHRREATREAGEAAATDTARTASQRARETDAVVASFTTRETPSVKYNRRGAEARGANAAGDANADAVVEKLSERAALMRAALLAPSPTSADRTRPFAEDDDPPPPPPPKPAAKAARQPAAGAADADAPPPLPVRMKKHKEHKDKKRRRTRARQRPGPTPDERYPRVEQPGDEDFEPLTVPEPPLPWPPAALGIF